MTTFLAIAENSKLEFVSFSADAKGKLEKLAGQSFMMTEITLRPKLVLKNARDAERALRILEKAEKHCLISNSIKTQTKLERISSGRTMRLRTVRNYSSTATACDRCWREWKTRNHSGVILASRWFSFFIVIFGRLKKRIEIGWREPFSKP
jgi:hypothetical protein